MAKVKAQDSVCIQLRLGRRISAAELKLLALLPAIAPGLAAPSRRRLERENRALRVS